MWWRVVLLGALFMGCKNDVFTLPSLNFVYKSAPVKDKPNLGVLVLGHPQVVFLREFVPKYYQRRYAKGLQKGIATLLSNKGYQVISLVKKKPQVNTEGALKATITGTIAFAFQSTPSDLKATSQMLKRTGNDYIDPVRVLRMLEINSDLKVCEGSMCQRIAKKIHEPIFRANPIDSDPNERSGPNRNYNDAIIEGLNRLYQQILQDLEKQLKTQLKTMRADYVI